MKIIDAFWEKRNLGVETVEFEIEDKDSEHVINEIVRNEKEYNVLKIPVGKPALLFLAQKKGYRFIECSYLLSTGLSNLKNTDCYFSDDIHASQMNDAEISFLYREIENGLFRTDRIYLDAFFTKEQAAQRYINWLEDERKSDSILYKAVLKKQSIDHMAGFFVFKKIDIKTNYIFLIGVFSEYQNRHLGHNVIYKSLLASKIQGADRVITRVSSNNPASVKSHLAVNYRLTDTKYVFIKHKETTI